VLGRIHAGEIRLVTRDTPEPSPLSHEILNARPYAFLDDAPLEERRSQAVYARRASEPSTANDLGALDTAAIDRVRDEQRPDPRDADELHDALMTAGFLTADEAEKLPRDLFVTLEQSRRAAPVDLGQRAGADGIGKSRPSGRPNIIWIAAERVPELRAIHGADSSVSLDVPSSRSSRSWTRENAIAELFRGRLSIVGPTTSQALAESLGIPEDLALAGLIALETDGAVLRGRFTGTDEREWCERRLLARIHRYTLNRLRAEIEPI